MKIVMPFLVLSMAVVGLADNLKTLTFNKEAGTARVCATVKVLKGTGPFSHSAFSGVINISGENSIFDDYNDSDEVCVEGAYRVDSRGFVAHLYIRDVEVVGGDKGADSEEAIVDELPETSPLRKLAEKINSDWDTNITSGLTRVTAGKLHTKLNLKTLKELSAANFRAEYEEALSDKAKLTTKTGKYAEKDIAMIVEAVAEGNDYAPENKSDRAGLKKEVTSLVGRLGKTESLLTLVAQTQLPATDDALAINIYAILLVNKDTGLAVRIFVIQGRI
ncbi:MAG: hypothetical protein HYR96_06400 [Deltaproteobacteria bacterium]|nr:hypothetical protein [Deltaproteobacteria bacterium]MBI3295856.1 hypothetical protein [Deltaproteobacteria bacterium]